MQYCAPHFCESPMKRPHEALCSAGDGGAAPNGSDGPPAPKKPYVQAGPDNTKIGAVHGAAILQWGCECNPELGVEDMAKQGLTRWKPGTVSHPSLKRTVLSIYHKGCPFRIRNFPEGLAVGEEPNHVFNNNQWLTIHYKCHRCGDHVKVHWPQRVNSKVAPDNYPIACQNCVEKDCVEGLWSELNKHTRRYLVVHKSYLMMDDWSNEAFSLAFSEASDDGHEDEASSEASNVEPDRKRHPTFSEAFSEVPNSD